MPKTRTDDLRIGNIAPLISPAVLAHDLPITDADAEVVQRGRDEATAILEGKDDRLLVVTGPCSIHDTEAALEYARRLEPLIRNYRGDL